jgi:tRNA (Thr-GGU) A37 N-methylase
VPIGWVESPLTDRAQAPRQGDEGAPPAWIAFEPEVSAGIHDLRVGAEVTVLTWLDRAETIDGIPVADVKPVLDKAAERKQQACGPGGKEVRPCLP